MHLVLFHELLCLILQLPAIVAAVFLAKFRKKSGFRIFKSLKKFHLIRNHNSDQYGQEYVLHYYQLFNHSTQLD